jgi:hypothetical protein
LSDKYVQQARSAEATSGYLKVNPEFVSRSEDTLLPVVSITAISPSTARISQTGM